MKDGWIVVALVTLMFGFGIVIGPSVKSRLTCGDDWYVVPNGAAYTLMAKDIDFEVMYLVNTKTTPQDLFERLVVVSVYSFNECF